jgi:hypothetical protein
VAGRFVVSIPSRFRGRARRDAAAFYLSELARESRRIYAGVTGAQFRGAKL